jgi:hypothetical protein
VKGRVIAVALVAAVLVMHGVASAERVERVATSLSLRASDRTVVYGDRVRFLASLSGPGAGETIALERVAGGPSGEVGSCETGQAGRCSITTKPRGTATYRAVFAGAGSWDPSTSDLVTVRVGIAILGELERSYGRQGRYRLYHEDRQVFYIVTVEPRRKGRPVVFDLEFNYGRGWRDGGTSRFRTAHDGTVRLYFAGGSLPRGRYRIRAATDGGARLLDGRAPWAYFRVTA